MFSAGYFYRSALCPVGRHLIKSAFHTSGIAHVKVAIVLSGCGVYDGTEIHEASALLTHLSRARAGVAMFAPDCEQKVVNHLTGEVEEGATRNALVESARIARGKVTPLRELSADCCDAVIFPGGFGAAKTLSTFATEGANMTLHEDVDRVLKSFHQAGKPIGLCCISPVLAAKAVLGCEVTVGSSKEEGGRWPHAEAADCLEQMGAKHIRTDVDDIHTDRRNKIVTTPAYMCNAPLHEISQGIETLVEKIICLVGDGHK